MLSRATLGRRDDPGNDRARVSPDQDRVIGSSGAETS